MKRRLPRTLGVLSALRVLHAIAVLCAMGAASATFALPPGDGVFGSATVVPADVGVVVHVRGAKGLRADAAMLPWAWMPPVWLTYSWAPMSPTSNAPALAKWSGRS